MLAPKHRDLCGSGFLAVELGPQRSMVTGALAHSPLRLLEPRNAGTAAWVFTATFGGGLLEGDRVELEVTIGAGAAALVGTQAQTKVFRAGSVAGGVGEVGGVGGVGAAQMMRAEVGAGGLLVWLPDPVVCFAGARYQGGVDVRLGAGAGAVLVEGLTAGRSARGERWAFERFASRTRVWGAGSGAEELWLDDALVLDAAVGGELGERMRGWEAVATVTVVGGRVEGVAEGLRKMKPTEAVVAVSDVKGGVVARVAGKGTAAVVGAVRSLLVGLPGLLGDDPFARKW